MCEGKTAPQNLQSSAEWQWMCGSRKYPYLPHRRLFDLHPPTPHDFPFQGVFDDLPSPQEFPELLNGDLLPPSEIQSGFSTFKKKKWIPTQLRKHSRILSQQYKGSVNFS